MVLSWVQEIEERTVWQKAPSVGEVLGPGSIPPCLPLNTVLLYMRSTQVARHIHVTLQQDIKRVAHH